MPCRLAATSDTRKVMCVRSTGREYTDSASLNVLRPLLGYTHDTAHRLSWLVPVTSATAQWTMDVCFTGGPLFHVNIMCRVITYGGVAITGEKEGRQAIEGCKQYYSRVP